MGEGAFASDGGGQLETGAGRVWSEDKWGKLATPTQRQGRHGTSPKLLLGLTFEGRAAPLTEPIQHVTRLRVATLVVRAQTPQAGWVEAVRRPIQLSTLVVRSPSHHQAIAMWPLLPGGKASQDVPQVNSPNELQLWNAKHCGVPKLRDTMGVWKRLQQGRSIGGGPTEGCSASIATSLHRALWQTPPPRTV